MPPQRTVFISYSHKDESWKDRLLPHLKALEQAGVDMAVWQDRQIDAGAQWYPEIREAMANAAVAVLLISAEYLASGFCIKEEVPFLLDRQEGAGMLLIPVLVRQCPWKAHRWLAARQMLPRDGKCIAIDFPGDQADAVFSQVAEMVLRHFEQSVAKPESRGVLSGAESLCDRTIKTMHVGVARTITPPSGFPPDEAALRAWLDAPPGDCVDLSRLSETGSALFGRDEELSLLDRAWASGEGPAINQTRVLVFTANGGVGKSTLVNHWLAEMRRDGFRGAKRVFGWSFYSQGSREQGTASADTFITAALRFFGDPDPMSGSPWDKGERLAGLVGAERALLVLDGLEPLQSRQALDRGKLRDPALAMLLRGLARHSAGLCLISTREPLADLVARPGVVAADLEQISPQAGRAVLRTARVLGTDAELESLAKRFGPHALAVSLLGVYLHEHSGGGLGPAQELEAFPGDTPVDRVLGGFERWLGDQPEFEALRLLGFFDRPAEAGCLAVLCAPPAIPGLNARVTGLGDGAWQRQLARLEKLGLVHIRNTESGQRLVDSHPLIREHFARQLRAQPQFWREGNRRLFEYLCANTPDKPQPTLEDLQPLFQAVAHGCEAGLAQQAFDDVYWSRLSHKDRALHNRPFGASYDHLSCLACFFEDWAAKIPRRGLDLEARSTVVDDVGHYLFVLGNLREGAAVIEQGLRQRVAIQDWNTAARSARLLREAKLLLGEIAEAVTWARGSVEYADKGNDSHQRLLARGCLAQALHYAGQDAEAERWFDEMCRLQAAVDPTAQGPYGVFGFWYGEYLLDRGRPEAAKACVPNLRAEAHRRNWRMDEAVASLIEGRAETAIAENSGTQPGSGVAALFEYAADTLRRIGQMHHAVAALVQRAGCRARLGRSQEAQSDLDEAWEIAERGQMRLFMADIHLCRARLFYREANYPWVSLKADLAAAEELIDECGYHRRDEELADAMKAILGG